MFGPTIVSPWWNLRNFCKNNENVTSLTCTAVSVFIPSEPRVTHWPCIWSSSVCAYVVGTMHLCLIPHTCLYVCMRTVCVYLCVFSGNVPGMRPAEAGEFTRRAFQAGKMGLTEVVKKSVKNNTKHRTTQICCWLLIFFLCSCIFRFNY